MNCDIVYAVVPRQPLEDMVWRQALERAAEELGTYGAGDFANQDPSPEDEALFEQVEALAYSLVDRQGLWRGNDAHRLAAGASQPVARAGPAPPDPSAS